jgi:DNA invertase Pin-like site-specific DNA recombinase
LTGLTQIRRSTGSPNRSVVAASSSSRLQSPAADASCATSDSSPTSLSDLTTTLEELRALKVDFVSVTEGLDFTTPSGRALAGMLGIFAEFERDILRERVRAGMEHARTKGVVLGRPATAQAQADQIHRLLAAGMSKKAVARKLGIGRASIYRAIENHAG